MSRAAYISHYGVAPPAGAVFGADISWFQATEDGESLDHGVAAGYWADIVSWADFVCVRTSYGASGDDGAEGLHFQVADERGYAGSMGTYHFPNVGRSAADNVANYLRRSAPFVERTKYDMLDWEGSVAPAWYIDESCDRVEQARQRPCFQYGGYSYMDQAGVISCPASKFWLAQYTSSRWPWGTYDMPGQYAGSDPGVWQWSSSTPEHGHLDLNISTTPAMLGIGAPAPTGDDFLMALSQADQQELLDKTRMVYAVLFDDGGRWGKLWTAAAQTERVAAVVERLNTDSYVHSTGVDPSNPNNSRNVYDELRAFMAKPAGAVDVDKLAAALGPKLPAPKLDEDALSLRLAQRIAALRFGVVPAA